MPYKETYIEKKYWSIGEIAEMLQINTSNVRFWEDTFPWIHAKRNRKNDRRYTKETLGELMQINLLVKLGGLTLDGIKVAHNMGYQNELLEFIVDKHRNWRLPDEGTNLLDLKKYPLPIDEAYKHDA